MDSRPNARAVNNSVMPEAAPAAAGAADLSVDLSSQQPTADVLASPPGSPPQGQVDSYSLTESPLVGQLSMGGVSGRKDASLAEVSPSPAPAVAWGDEEIDATDGDSDGAGAQADACDAAPPSMFWYGLADWWDCNSSGRLWDEGCRAGWAEYVI